MRIPRLQPQAVRNKSILFTGGLNEEAARLQLKPGEMQYCQNYFEIAGPYSGYASVLGYERFDGQEAPSSVHAVEGDDTDREAARTAILEVDSTNGTGAVLGLGYFDDTVLAWRASTTNVEMWLSSAAGWSQAGISGTNAWVNTGGSFNTVKYKFADYNNGDEILVIVDGKSQPRTWNGTTLVDISTLAGAVNLPTSDYPFQCGTYNNRLFLAYEKGFLFFSAVDDPTNFDNIINTAGYLYLGDEITNIIEAPGNVLVIICKNKISILKGNDYDAELNQWVPNIETFSRSNGGFALTAQRFMGDVFYADEEGVTNMASTDVYGDFNNSIVSNKVQKTFLTKKSLLTTSLVDRHYNQYRLFFSDGSVIYFTFKKEGLKGATTGVYPKPVKKVLVVEDSSGSSKKYFASTDGYVYEMDVGTSFDGSAITTTMITSYHSYGYPRNWKYFQRLTMEVEVSSALTLKTRQAYDYNEAYMPDVPEADHEVSPTGGVWGEGLWGTMVWGGSGNNREILYLSGYGTNMAIEIRTESKYAQSHILQNMIVDFTLQENKL